MTPGELFATTRAEPREYQLRIVQKACHAFLYKGSRSVLIESPTGSGKTVMALAIAALMQRDHGKRVGFSAMRRPLLAQAQRESAAMGFDVDMALVSMFDKNPPKDIDLLVVDEAQHDVTSSMSHIHATIDPAFTLGLSATPFRADRMKLCFDTLIKDANIQALIAAGYLAKYHHYLVPYWGADEVVGHYVRDRERWGKSLVYFHRLADCWRAWQLLHDAGVSADVVHAGSNNTAQLLAFEQGETQVLLNCMLLGEGFNAPDLKTVWIRPSVKSVTTQMGGRVLRVHPDHAYKQVVQSADTKWNFCRTAPAAMMYTLVEGKWRAITPTEMVEDTAKAVLRVLAHTETIIPKILQSRESTNRRVRRAAEELANDPTRDRVAIDDAEDTSDAGLSEPARRGDRIIRH